MIRRREFLGMMGMSTSALVAASCAATRRSSFPRAGKKKPNIVYILADDWGYGDLSCLNPQSKLNTIHTDAIAHDGMIFTDAHSNSAVCTPTRYGVLTGRYAFRSRLKSGVLVGESPPLIEPGRMTVASFLRGHGYHTACIGKWHLGWQWAKENKGYRL